MSSNQHWPSLCGMGAAHAAGDLAERALAQKRLGPAERGRGRQSTGRRIRLERKRAAHEMRAHRGPPRDGGTGRLAGTHDLAPRGGGAPHAGSRVLCDAGARCRGAGGLRPPNRLAHRPLHRAARTMHAALGSGTALRNRATLGSNRAALGGRTTLGDGPAFHRHRALGSGLPARRLGAADRLACRCLRTDSASRPGRFLRGTRPRCA